MIETKNARPVRKIQYKAELSGKPSLPQYKYLIFDDGVESLFKVHENPAYCPHCQVPYPRISRSTIRHPVTRFFFHFLRRQLVRCHECQKKFVVPKRKIKFRDKPRSSYRYAQHYEAL